jgi:HlyD family secretion protein
MTVKLRASILAAAGGTVALSSLALIHHHVGARAEMSATPSAAAPHRVRAEGILVPTPGAEVIIRSEMTGTLTLVTPHGSAVSRGHVIARIRAAEDQAAYAAARAQLADEEAQTRFARSELRRDRRLFQSAVITSAALEVAQRERDTHVARVDARRADVARLAAVVKRAALSAPIDGTVVARAAEIGERVNAGDVLLTIADLRRTRIEAEVAEADMAGIAVGANAIVTAEGHPGQTWIGTVVEIPRVVVPSRLRPQDPSRSSDTGVVSVKIALEAATPLRLRERVGVAIEPATQTFAK